MIVVDTNVIAYFYLPTEYTPLAEKLLMQEPVWAAPTLWRSEFRNVLALYLRKKALTFDQAYGIQTEAERLLAEHEFEMGSYEVLRLAETSRCSAYDCEFVALARHLDLPLVTADKMVLKAFPSIAISLAESVA
ncbi:MAG: type II toxin-antitoxin system VapC family toxin [Methylothermaceae bacterium]|nr:type II toxin-antitoxin system VapC family toxin [Methylothermaceae bacterium]